MAVPIRSATGVQGSLSVVWLNDDMNLEEVLEIGALDDLRNALARIGIKLDQAKLQAPMFEFST